MSVNANTNARFAMTILRSFISEPAFPSSEIKLSGMSGEEILEGTKEMVFRYNDNGARFEVEVKNGFFPEPFVKYQITQRNCSIPEVKFSTPDNLPIKMSGAVISYEKSEIRGEGKISETRKFYKNGRLHRDNGPAVEVFFLSETGERFIAARRWYREGNLHRETGPATITFNCMETIDSGVRSPYLPGISRYSYYLDGSISRKNGPTKVVLVGHTADTIENERGLKRKEEIWKNTEGWSHREDGPAIIKTIYDESGVGTVISEEWCIEGRIRNDNGPAVIIRKTIHVFSANRELTEVAHGPQLKTYYKDGKIVQHEE